MKFNLKKAQVFQQEVDKAIVLLTNLGIDIPPGMPPEDILTKANKIQTSSQKGQDAFVNLEELGQAQEQMAQEAIDAQENIQTLNTGSKIMTKIKKSFNLKKAQEFQPPMDPMGLNDNPEMMGDQLDQQNNMMENPMDQQPEIPKFKSGRDLKEWLERIESSIAREELFKFIDITQEEKIEQKLNNFYEMSETENKKNIEADNLFELLPPILKQIDINEPGTIMAPFTRAINESNNEIKKIAQNNTKNKKIYNLKKIAQHKSFDTSVIMYGPDQVRIDPFYRQPVSDYSIVERNKGFGLVVDDIWNIDWETIWRGNIMDKYSRPYRNKEGKWVGGYINKRFEVDSWIPETNNYQLKPGQTRRPYLPEYGSTEARLQSARNKDEIKGQPVVDKSAPFNWKEANSKKKKVS